MSHGKHLLIAVFAMAILAVGAFFWVRIAPLILNSWVSDLSSPVECLEVECSQFDFTFGLPKAGEEASLQRKDHDIRVLSGAVLKAKLQNGSFAELDDYFELLLSAYLENHFTEYQYRQAVYDLGGLAQENLKFIRLWLAATGSVHAQFFEAEALGHIGPSIRGGKWASNTAREKLEAYDKYQKLAAVSFVKTLELNPQYLLAYQGLFSAVAPKDAAKADLYAWYQKMQHHLPQAYYPRAILILKHRPRWGGSYRQMRHFAEDAQQFVQLNPRLRALFGFEWADKANRLTKLKMRDEAVIAWDAALYHGSLYSWLEPRAALLWNLKRFKRLEQDARQMLKLKPGQYKARYYLVVALSEQEKFTEAEPIFAELLAEYPEEAELWTRWGISAFKQKQFKSSRDRLLAALQLDTDDELARFYLGFAYLNLHDAQSAGVFARYLKRCEDQYCDPVRQVWVQNWMDCYNELPACELESGYYVDLLESEAS